ncbi:MAG TPA: hypothetical protein VNF71_02020 [Acidimicrobiales bacterium]|nr:hypothetical protein [Acidimicrobiales bacterium]
MASRNQRNGGAELTDVQLPHDFDRGYDASNVRALLWSAELTDDRSA